MQESYAAAADKVYVELIDARLEKQRVYRRAYYAKHKNRRVGLERECAQVKKAEPLNLTDAQRRKREYDMSYRANKKLRLLADAAGLTQPTVVVPPPPKVVVPRTVPEWQPTFASDGRMYWWNIKTSATSWTTPHGAQAAIIAYVASSNSA